MRSPDIKATMTTGPAAAGLRANQPVSMRSGAGLTRVVPAIFFLFVLFPFTQLVPLPTYNQPYAVLIASLIILGLPRIFLMLPQSDQLMLGYLALLGIGLFLVSAMEGVQFREISFLISYLTPVFTTAVCYWIMLKYRSMAVRLLTFSIFMWAIVGFIQSLGFPNFLTGLASHHSELGSNLVASGRGTLSFAPEPTHFGFHMVLLATALYLLRGPVWVALIAVGAVAVLAKSSSAVLALGVGVILWACVRPFARIWIFIGIFAVIAFSAIIPFLFDDSYRITSIILAIYYDGFHIFLLDYSVNARLSGMFAPFYLFQYQAFVPLGMGISDWAEVREHMLYQFPWIIDLSGSGPASGIGLILLQGGIFAVPVVLYFVKRFVFTLGRRPEGVLTAACFFVFMGQFYLATPTFGLVLAALIVRSHDSA